MNKSLRLYSPFDNSDLIIASPLGLRLAIENLQEETTVKEEENKKKKESRKEREKVSFLSSVEVLVVEQGNTILM